MRPFFVTMFAACAKKIRLKPIRIRLSRLAFLCFPVTSPDSSSSAID